MRVAANSELGQLLADGSTKKAHALADGVLAQFHKHVPEGFCERINATNFWPGQKVQIKDGLFETACGEHPSLWLAKKGDVVVIRRKAYASFDWAVSHEDRTDGATFAVYNHEIEALQ